MLSNRGIRQRVAGWAIAGIPRHDDEAPLPKEGQERPARAFRVRGGFPFLWRGQVYRGDSTRGTEETEECPVFDRDRLLPQARPGAGA
jgi:hypothetical protein